MDLRQELKSAKQHQEQLRLENTLLRQKLENTLLRQKLEETLAKIKELEARLNQDSQNSNWPLRMMKLQQKVSGCFLSWEGAYQFARLRSYLSTIRKQGLSVWEALGSLFKGDVLMPALRPE